VFGVNIPIMVFNYWNRVLQIREASKLLSLLLTDQFRGYEPNTKEWLDMLEDLIGTLYGADPVVISGLMDYRIICLVDEYGDVYQLSLVEKV